MTRQISPRRLVVMLILWLALLLVGHRLFFQFRSVPTYIGSMPPLPALVQERVNQTPHLTPPQRAALVGVSFTSAPNRFVSRLDLWRIRGRLAWGTGGPYWVETLMIHDADHVTAYVNDRQATWIELVRREGSWRVERLINPDAAPLRTR